MNTLSPQRKDAGPDADWNDHSLAELVDFILTRYHQPLWQGLPVLVERARQVEAEGASSPLAPAGLADHLEQIRLAVESHLAKEERILFPLIVAGRGRHALMPIRVMMAEHDDHGDNLRRTRELTHDFALPGDASPEWSLLYRDLQQLEGDLNRHIHLENKMLFPRALES